MREARRRRGFGLRRPARRAPTGRAEGLTEGRGRCVDDGMRGSFFLSVEGSTTGRVRREDGGMRGSFFLSGTAQLSTPAPRGRPPRRAPAVRGSCRGRSGHRDVQEPVVGSPKGVRGRGSSDTSTTTGAPDRADAVGRLCRVGTPGRPGAPLTEPYLCCSHTALRDAAFRGCFPQRRSVHDLHHPENSESCPTRASMTGGGLTSVCSPDHAPRKE